MSAIEVLLLDSASAGPFPVAPSRMEVLQARVPFQGFEPHTQQFGSFRAWGPELGSLNDDDARSYVVQAMAQVDDLGQRFDAVEFAVSWNYRTPYFNVPGLDLSQNLPELRRKVKQAIVTGAPLGLKAVNLFCAGDGESVNADPQPGQYNDPYGWTYGRQWFLLNAQRIYDAFGPQADDPDDLRDWMVFLAAYDGGDAYQWDSAANLFGVWQRLDAIVHSSGRRHGYTGFEWPAGQITGGDNAGTYDPQNGGCIDQWQLEDPTGWYPPTEDQPIRQITQQAGRAVWPYLRPSWAIDDPNPPLLIPPTNKYGEPTVAQFREHTTYDWVHGGPLSEVQNNRAVLRSIAPLSIVC